MKDLKSLAFRILYPTAAIYTLLSFLFTAIFFSSENEYSSPGITPKGMGVILLFSFLAAVSNLIFDAKNVHPAFRTLIHLGLLTADFTLCFLVLGGYFLRSGKTGLMVVLIFALLYAVVAVPVYFIVMAIRKNRRKTEAYDSIFQSGGGK